MIGFLFFLGLATFASAQFNHATFLQKGLKDQKLPPAIHYIIPSKQCTWELNLKQDGCQPYTLAVKVSDTGLKASPKITFNKDLNEVHIRREGMLCLGQAKVEVQALCYPESGFRRSASRWHN